MYCNNIHYNYIYLNKEAIIDNLNIKDKFIIDSLNKDCINSNSRKYISNNLSNMDYKIESLIKIDNNSNKNLEISVNNIKNKNIKGLNNNFDKNEDDQMNNSKNLYNLEYNKDKININLIEDKINNDQDINFEINTYKYIIKNYNKLLFNKSIKIGNNIHEIPKFPILIGDKINLDYYTDIYRYLYIRKNNLNVERYPKNIINIKNINIRDNKKREYRLKIKKYYLDQDNNLYKKFNYSIKDDRKNFKIINEDGVEYILYKIPQKIDILAFLYDVHKEDIHRDLNSFRNYLKEKNIYIEGSVFLTDYIIKNCITCLKKIKRLLIENHLDRL